MSCTLYKAGWHWTHSRLVLLCVRNRLHLQARVKKEITEGHNCITVDTTSKQIIAYTQTHHKPTRHARKEKECPFNVRHWVTKTGACLGGNHVCRLWIQFGPHCYTRNFFFLKHQPLWQLYPASLKFEWSCVQPNSFYASIFIKTNPPLPSKWPGVQRTNATSSTPALQHPAQAARAACPCLVQRRGMHKNGMQRMYWVAMRWTVLQWGALWCSEMHCDTIWDALSCSEMQMRVMQRSCIQTLDCASLHCTQQRIHLVHHQSSLSLFMLSLAAPTQCTIG